jgi:hypothetical protein
VTVDDLVEWLRLQLDDDERIAQVPSGNGYEPDIWEIQPSRSGRWSQVVSISRVLGEPIEAAGREDPQPVALVQSGRWEDRHIVNWDPDRVLREVEAKRKILARHASRDHFCPAPIDHDGYIWFEAGEERRADIPCGDLRDLAAPYSDRPGFREEWTA